MQDLAYVSVHAIRDTLPDLTGIGHLRPPSRETMGAMHIIITVTGTDHVGIIAGVSQALAELGVNIVNVSQTLMGKYFTMIMEGALTDAAPDLPEVQRRLQEAGQRHGVTVRVQSEAIFDAMHTL